MGKSYHSRDFLENMSPQSLIPDFKKMMNLKASLNIILFCEVFERTLQAVCHTASVKPILSYNEMVCVSKCYLKAQNDSRVKIF